MNIQQYDLYKLHFGRNRCVCTAGVTRIIIAEVTTCRLRMRECVQRTALLWTLTPTARTRRGRASNALSQNMQRCAAGGVKKMTAVVVLGEHKGQPVSRSNDHQDRVTEMTTRLTAWSVVVRSRSKSALHRAVVRRVSSHWTWSTQPEHPSV